MQKIQTLFVRDKANPKLVTREVSPGCEWVIEGEGVATRKWDGTCCLIRDCKMFKRYDAKKGNTPPAGFEPAQPEPDPVSGHWPGWLAVGDGPEDKWHREGLGAWVKQFDVFPSDGTYELIGYGVQGNVEAVFGTFLEPHGIENGNQPIPDFPRDFDGIKAALSDGAIEGVVWHHPDGRMAKIKAKDFGIKRVKA